MSMLLGENPLKDLEDHYNPEQSLEELKKELYHADFNKRTPLERARYSRFLATKSLSSLARYDPDEYDKDEREDLISTIATKIRTDNPDKFSEAYETEVTRSKYGGRGPAVTRKEIKSRPLGNYFEELSRESLKTWSDEELDKIPSIQLIQLRDDLNIEDYDPALHKRMTSVGKKRSENLSESKVFWESLARGVIPMYSEIEGRSDEEKASLYLGYDKAKTTEVLGSTAALIGGGWVIQAFRRSLGMAGLVKNIALTGGLEGLLAVGYKDVAPGIVAELAGKPDDWKLNAIEAMALSSLVDAIPAMRAIATFKKTHGMTFGQFLRQNKAINKVVKGLQEGMESAEHVDPSAAPTAELSKLSKTGIDADPVVEKTDSDVPVEKIDSDDPSFTQQELVADPALENLPDLAKETAAIEATGNSDNFMTEVGQIISKLPEGIISKLPKGLKDPAQSGLKHVKKFVNDYFTKEGKMGEGMYKPYYKMVSHLGADYWKINKAKDDLLDVINGKYGKYTPPTNIGKQINDVLSDASVPPSTLTALDADELVEPVKKMRDLLDEFSEKILEIEGIHPGLRAIIKSNQTSYIYRSYKSYTQRGWEKILKSTDEGREAIEGARRFLQKEYPNIDEDEINYMLDTFIKPKQMKGHDSFYDSYMAMDANTRKIFKKRQNIPEELLKIMGPEDDGIINFLATAHKQAHFLQTYKMLDEIRVNELGERIFKEPTFKDGRMYDKKIAGSDLPEYDPYDELRPLAGYYTDANTQELLSTMDQIKLTGPVWGIYKFSFLGPKAFSQMAKTIPNPATHVRNWMGGGLMVAANGNFIRPFMGKVKGGNEGIQHAWDTVLTDLRGLNKTELREIYEKYMRLGIIATEARIGETLDLLKRMPGSTYIEEILRKNNKGTVGFGKAKKWSFGLYQAEDDFWKIYNFNAERQAYAEVYGIKENYIKQFPNEKIPKIRDYHVPEIKVKKGEYVDDLVKMKKELDAVGVESWGNDLLDETAAEITRAQIPNYREVSKSIRALRLMPFGNFISFPAEIMRTSANIMKRGWKEMQNPLTRHIGKRRLASFASFGLGAGAATAMVTRQLTNTSAVQDHDLRRFMPYWSENSNIQYISNSHNGVIKYLDLSYTDPYEYLKRPFYAILRNIAETDSDKIDTDILEGFTEAMGEFARPFLDPSMITQAIHEIAANTRYMDGKPRGQIYDPIDSTGDKVLKSLKRLAEPLTPGGLTGVKRLVRAARGEKTKGGQPSDFMAEMMAFSGLRVSTLDIKVSLKHNGWDHLAGIQNSRKIFTRKARDGSGTVSPEELIKELYDSQTSRYNYFQEAYRDMEAAASNGVSRRKTARIFRDKSNMGKDDVRAIERGAFRAYTPSKETYRTMIESGHERDPGEVAMIKNGINMVIKNMDGMPLNADPNRSKFLRQR